MICVQNHFPNEELWPSSVEDFIESNTFCQKMPLNRGSSNDHPAVVVIETEWWLIPRGENCKITVHRNLSAGIHISIVYSSHF